MKFKIPIGSKVIENLKLALTIALFASMLVLFVFFAEIKLGSLGIPNCFAIASKFYSMRQKPTSSA